MMGNSGLFGDDYTPEPIDDLGETSQVVEEIVSGMAEPGAQATAADASSVSFVLGLVMRRQRILTIAVIAIAAYLLAKDFSK